MRQNKSEEICVSALLDGWLNVMKQQSVRLTSLGMYQSQVNNYIKPLLGEYLIKELPASAGKDLVRQLEKEGLSPKTARDIAGKFYQALRWGVEQGYDIPQLQKPGKSKDDTSRLRILSAEEQVLVERSLGWANKALQNAIILAMKAGLSVGELCALSCQDINSEREIMRIHRICQRTSNGLSYLECEARVVPLPKGLSINREDEKFEFFLLSPRHSPLEPRLCQLWLKQYLNERGLPKDITFTALRNTYIKDLMESGMDFIEISRRSGNKNLNELWQRFGRFYKSA